MQLNPQQKEGFIHWSREERCCWKNIIKGGERKEKIKGERKKRTGLHKIALRFLIKKCISSRVVCGFIWARRPSLSDLLYTTLSEGHLWPTVVKAQYDMMSVSFRCSFRSCIATILISKGQFFVVSVANLFLFHHYSAWEKRLRVSFPPY